MPHAGILHVPIIWGLVNYGWVGWLVLFWGLVTYGWVGWLVLFWGRGNVWVCVKAESRADGVGSL